MELLNNFIKSGVNFKKKEHKREVKPFNERRVVTRKIMRNKLKFELKNQGYPKVNKNFRYILQNMDFKERIKLLNK